MATPQIIRMDERDNVAVVATTGGLPAGTALPGGPTLREAVPQGHKVALLDIAAGAPVLRYGVAIGHAAQALPAGSWVHERVLAMPAARGLDQLPIATARRPAAAPLEGHTFEGYRNADGSVGTRNILAVTTTVQCVAGVVAHAVQRIKAELLPRYPHVDDVVGLEHSYGCGVAIDAEGDRARQCSADGDAEAEDGPEECDPGGVSKRFTGNHRQKGRRDDVAESGQPVGERQQHLLGSPVVDRLHAMCVAGHPDWRARPEESPDRCARDHRKQAEGEPRHGGGAARGRYRGSDCAGKRDP